MSPADKGRVRPRSEAEGGDEFARLRTSYLRLKSALRDPTTGLYAFPLLFDEVRSLLDGSGAAGVLTVEVGNLGLVESIYGWQVFDRVLRRAAETVDGAVGEILPATSRVAISGVRGDVLVAFVAGASEDEPGSPRGLAAMARGLEEILAKAFSGPDYETMAPRPRFRVGYSLLADNPFFRFERLVYRSVEESRRLAERDADRQRLAWSAELKRILSEGRIESVYQPIVDLEDGSVVGFEALARGPRESVFAMPRVMFSFSGQVGMAAELDRTCRRAALEGVAGARLGGRLFLNTLPEALSDPEWYSERLAELLRRLGLEPSDVVLEIPDRASEGRLALLAPEVERLRRAGYGIALDNVGTGYSSMEAIAELRPDFLKVDLSLVHGLDGNLLKQEVVRSLGRLASKMGAVLVAGGIERPAERDAVRRCGVRLGQGHLIAGATAPPRARSIEP